MSLTSATNKNASLAKPIVKITILFGVGFALKKAAEAAK